MYPKRTQTSYVVTLMTLLALTACGKNMSVAFKDSTAANADGTPGTIDASKVGGSSADVKQPDTTKPSVGMSTAPLAPISPNKTTVTVIDPSVDKRAVQNASLDGQLQPYSPYDLSDSSAKRLFLNPDSVYATRVIGAGAVMDRSTGLNFNRKSNLVFRAILPMHSKADIKEVKKFELHLTGLRVFAVNGSGMKKHDLSNQILCIAETGECSGQLPADAAEKQNLNSMFTDSIKVKSEEFSKSELNIMADYGDDGAVFADNGERVLDMRKLFGLEKLSTAELVEWIYANSTEFAEPGYRKFRFVAGNSVHVDAGELVLELVSSGVTAAQEGVATHGETDQQSPVSANPEMMPMAKAIVTLQPMGMVQSKIEITAPTDIKINSAAVVTPEAVTPEAASTTDESQTGVLSDGSQSTLDTTPQTAVADAVTTAPAEEPAVDTASDGIADVLDSEPNTLSAVPMVMAEAPAVVIVRNQDAGTNSLQMNLDDLHLNFDTDKVTIKKSAQAKLKATVASLKKHSGQVVKIRIIGRTDKVAAEDYNMDLSIRRANAVAKALSSSGVKTLMKGEGEPATSSCGNKEECRQDRRVDINLEFAKGLKESKIQAIRAEMAIIWKVSK